MIAALIFLYILIGFSLATILIATNSVSTQKNKFLLLFVVFGWSLIIPLFVLYIVGCIILKLLECIEKYKT